MSGFRDTESNLLFGLLSLVNDLVTRQQLLDAATIWFRNTERGLDEILEEIGALTARDRRMLGPMVEKHIEDHGNNPVASIQALSSITSLWADLRERSVGISSEISMVDPKGASTVKNDANGESATTGRHPGNARFHLLKQIDEGGLGVIWEAYDNELNRVVAVKQIQEKQSHSDDSIAQFLLEAEITGGLEHPGIVPVYGLGSDNLGRPFYAMKFIGGSKSPTLKQQGDNLFDKIRKYHATPDALDYQRLLNSFIDVCNAMQFAHKRGVLHRDLKPRNIMVGETGETLVVDWGLARTIPDQPSTEEQAEWRLNPQAEGSTGPERDGHPIGTPEYMSPEQADGKISQLGETTDVYSLGATLYCILTGEAPFSRKRTKSVTLVLDRVKAGQFNKPRSVNPDVPIELEAICLKAMALNAEDRYQKVGELADDVRRWMADEPVAAWKEPLTGRAKRWMRKHPRSVASASAALLVGLVVSVVAGKQINDAKQDVQRSFEITSKTIDEYFVTVSESNLLNVPHLRDLRINLLKKAERAYEREANAGRNDFESQLRAAKTTFRLGKIKEAELPDQLPEEYTKATEICRKLANRKNDVQVSRLLGKIQTATGRFWDNTAFQLIDDLAPDSKIHDALDKAIANYKASLSTRKSVAQRTRSWMDERYLANAYMNLGQFAISILEEENRTPSLHSHSHELSQNGTERLLEVSLDHMKKAVSLKPDNAIVELDLAKSKYNLGRFHELSKKLENKGDFRISVAAHQAFTDSAKIAANLQSEKRRNQAAKHQAARALTKMGDHDVNATTKSEAYLSAFKNTKHLVSDSPHDPILRNELIYLGRRLAKTEVENLVLDDLRQIFEDRDSVIVSGQSESTVERLIDFVLNVDRHERPLVVAASADSSTLDLRGEIIGLQLEVLQRAIESSNSIDSGLTWLHAEALIARAEIAADINGAWPNLNQATENLTVVLENQNSNELLGVFDTWMRGVGFSLGLIEFLETEQATEPPIDVEEARSFLRNVLQRVKTAAPKIGPPLAAVIVEHLDLLEHQIDGSHGKR